MATAPTQSPTNNNNTNHKHPSRYERPPHDIPSPHPGIQKIDNTLFVIKSLQNDGRVYSLTAAEIAAALRVDTRVREGRETNLVPFSHLLFAATVNKYFEKGLDKRFIAYYGIKDSKGEPNGLHHVLGEPFTFKDFGIKPEHCGREVQHPPPSTTTSPPPVNSFVQDVKVMGFLAEQLWREKTKASSTNTSSSSKKNKYKNKKNKNKSSTSGDKNGKRQLLNNQPNPAAPAAGDVTEYGVNADGFIVGGGEGPNAQPMET